MSDETFDETQREVNAVIGGVYSGSPGFIVGYNLVLRSPYVQAADAAERQKRILEGTEPSPITSMDMYEYLQSIQGDPEQYENLVKALFVEGHITFQNDVEELYDPEIVFNGMLDVMSEVTERAQQLGVSPQQVLAATEDKDQFIPTLDRKFKETDIDLFEEKLGETQQGLVMLPDMAMLEEMYAKQAIDLAGFDATKTDPTGFQNFIKGMRTAALAAKDRGEQYDVGAQIRQDIRTKYPDNVGFMQHKDSTSRLMDWMEKVRPT